MLRENLHITLLMVWVTVIANIIGAVLALAMQKWLIKICYLRPTILAPVILCFMAVGASLATKDFGDITISERRGLGKKWIFFPRLRVQSSYRSL